ncbi:MAG: hypothetical protein ABL889_11195 [Terricaulis sp.]
MNKLWPRLKAAFFLVLSIFLLVPSAALTCFRAQGNAITMAPFMELWVWGAALAGLSGVVIMSIKLFTGR